MYIANDLLKTISNPFLNEILDSFLDNLYQIVNKFIDDKKMFSLSDFSIHLLDEHIMQTSCHDNIFSCIYLEIDQPANYKPSTSKMKKSKSFEIPEMFISLSTIKNELHRLFLSHFDSNNIVWLEKYGICMKSSVISSEDNQVHEFYFKIIPCFTHYNKDNKRGIFYYSNHDIEIEYPDISLENFSTKNKHTNDLYRQTIVIFKNILLKNKDIERLPSEIIETLLYNVPNALFESTEKTCMLKIINFIRNNPLNLFKTIDEQDYAFSSIYRSMSIYYCKHILKIIENYLSIS